MKLSPNDIIKNSYTVTKYINAYSMVVSGTDCNITMHQIFWQIYTNFNEYIHGKVRIDIYAIHGFELHGNWYGYSL